VNIKLVKYVFVKMGFIAVVYLGGFVIVMAALSALFSIFDALPEGRSIPMAQVSLGSVWLFMFIMGLVMPLTLLRRFVEFGVTRGQYAMALGVAAVGIALCLTLAIAVAEFVSGSFEAFGTAVAFARNMAAFSVGGLVASGYLLRRAVTAVASTAFGVAVFHFANNALMDDTAWLLLYLALFALCSVVAVKAARDAPIKAS
jgi:hypothetical protein